MNRKTLWSICAALIVLCVAGCGGRRKVTVTITGPTSVAAGAAATYSATTTHDPKDKGVTWSCTTTGTTACSSTNFNPTATASGANTTFTAPATLETVTITATSVENPKDSASVTVTIVSTSGAISGAFVYSAAGQDFNDSYALVGVVVVSNTGAVTSGEQDYNDGSGITSPQPGGDLITGGSLTVDSTTGQGTLVIVTNDANVGVGGTITLGVQFVNNSHAQIIQFDASATSSGSLDLQTSTALPTGSFAFSFAGLDTGFFSLVAGGVFTFDALTSSGTIDVNDGGTVTIGNTSFDQTFGSPDASGRGSLTITNVPSFTGVAFNYYVVGPEVIRFIDVDAFGQVIADSSGDMGLGSAYGQGTAAGSFSASSIGVSTITLSGLPIFESFALVGQISPGDPAAVKPAVSRMPTTKTPDGISTNGFAGVVDVNEDGTVLAGNPLTGGGITMATTGYGSLTIPAGDAEDASNVGVYLIDPTLNVNDPNNTSGGGGALLVDLDANVNAISSGVLVPQTDILNADFAGNYGFGGQIFDPSDSNEADFIAQGSVTSLGLSGSGLFNDPFGEVTGSDSQVSGATFTGTFAPDTVNANAGRYTTTLIPTIVAGSPGAVSIAAYQASGTQLFFIEEDTTMTVGQIQQQSSLSSDVKKAAVKKPKP
jgi:hypothetical protein